MCIRDRSLLDRVWQATFSSFGGTRAGAPGHGLLLSRTQPRPEGEPDLPLEALQQPIVDAYLAALPQGVAPRILASRTLLVTDTEAEQYPGARPPCRSPGGCARRGCGVRRPG